MACWIKMNQPVLINGNLVDFNLADVNPDDVRYAELLQISCNCDNEITNVFNNYRLMKIN